jgi:hypothetical protein
VFREHEEKEEKEAKKRGFELTKSDHPKTSVELRRAKNDKNVHLSIRDRFCQSM